jgi:hypothetical protein
MNRTVHGLNSVRLLLATEDVEEYRQHLTDWVHSLAPATPAEHQIVEMVADLVWRLRRIDRLEARRALAILADLVEQTTEWKTRTQAQDVVLGLDALVRTVNSSPLPVPTAVLGGFLAGVRGAVHLLELFRGSLATVMWPEAAVCSFLGAVQKLTKESETEPEVSETFTGAGTTAAILATAVRTFLPTLDAAVEMARTAISTEILLVDDEDRRFERHRRILEASVARQLDLLAKVRVVAQPAAASGSFERAPQVELRVVQG